MQYVFLYEQATHPWSGKSTHDSSVLMSPPRRRARSDVRVRSQKLNFRLITRGSTHRPYKSRALRPSRFRSKFRSRRAKSLACVLFKFGKLLQLGTFSADLHATVVASLRKNSLRENVAVMLSQQHNQTKPTTRPRAYLSVSGCVLEGWKLVAISPT